MNINQNADRVGLSHGQRLGGPSKAVAWFRNGRNRGLTYLVLGAVLAVLMFFPRPYVARAKILPQENGSAAGLGSMIDVLGGRINDLSALLGQRNSIESYLLIGRSNEVVEDTVRRLRLVGPGGYPTMDRAKNAIKRRVDVHALLGGSLEIETRTHDHDRSLQWTQAYLDSVNSRIGTLSRSQVAAKRSLVTDRTRQATERLGRAETALTMFRQRNRLADPEEEFGAAVTQRTSLEAELQAKLVQLQTVQRFAGAENYQLRTLQAEVAALRRQIAESHRANRDATGPNLAAQSAISMQYLTLYRNYRFAQSLYDVYARFSEQVELQELAAQSEADVQVLERPHVDTQIQYNLPAAVLLAALVVLALFIEFYAPMTGMRLPFTQRQPQPAE